MKNCEVKHYDLSVDGNESTLFVLIGLTDEIIGSCMLFHDGLIQDFHIVEQFRGVDLGSELLEKVEEISKEKGMKFVHGLVKETSSVLKFWKKSGFSSCLTSEGWRISKEMIK